MKIVHEKRHSSSEPVPMRALKRLGCLLAKQEILETSSAFISCSFRPGDSG